MGIFSFKFDIERDKLNIGFDKENQVYYVYCTDVYIPYDRLNHKSKKILNKKNKELKTNPNLLKEELDKIKIKERYNKLTSMGYPCNSFEMVGIDNGTMSKSMEEYLTKLTNEEDVLLGIHRVGFTFNEQILEDELINGIKMTGNLGSGATSKVKLRDNISYFSDNKIIIKELCYANLYKDSPGSFLIRIPDAELNDNIFYINELNELRLKPQYILGYVPVSENHHIETIITANDIKKNQTDSYENVEENIYYELPEEPSRGGR